MKKRKKEKTIFRTILFAMLLVLGIEIVLLVSALYLSNVSTRLNQNAMDLLDMQTSNRADYLESILLFNQDLSRLSSCINEKASELSAAQKLDLSRIGDSSAEALPLLEEISSAMISTLRSKSVTGVFVAFTTEEFSKSSTVSAIPGMYLRDLDPTSPASAANDDLFLERSPIALVRSMGISTDKSWTTSFDLTQKPESAFLTPVFLATWADHGALDADNYGRWTILPYTLSGDDRPAIAYTIPLITSDGTIYGVVGIEMLVSYLQSLLPYSELQNESNGTYLLFSASAASLNSEPPSQIICRTAVCSTGNGMTLFEEEKQAFKLKEHPDGSFWLRSDGSTYYVSVTPLTLYSRNAPFSDEQWARRYRTSIKPVSFFQATAAYSDDRHCVDSVRWTRFQPDHQPFAGASCFPALRRGGCRTKKQGKAADSLPHGNSRARSVFAGNYTAESGYSYNLHKIPAYHGNGKY